ncbi:MAG TPA: carboxypeptidase regulatory-like domain-containing protein [Candidatus Sulfotelmatobacter sp.]|nr:carboxypeptidase regulatory-like domain-containing protein [Candidatus Sulfotelmatobacter sp.]
MKLSLTAGLLFLATPFAWAQTAPPPDLSDFTKSPTEHIIDQIEDPFRVRTVMGTITTTAGEEGRADVLLEIEGPNDERIVRHTLTDKHGRFKISKLPEGNYRFKATLYGFQSVMGTIIVSKHAPATADIRIEMRPGV